MESVLNFLADRVGIVPFITGMALLIMGLITMKFPPKEINLFYGHRSKRSMKNQEVWDFAQKHSSVRMILFGLFLIASSFLNQFINIGQEQSCVLGLVVLGLGCGFMFFATENAIKRKFPNL